MRPTVVQPGARSDSGDSILLLAAGSSSRMGQSKQLLSIKGQPLLVRAAHAAIDSGCENVVVVLGAHEQVHREAIAHLPVHTVHNPDWEKGMGSSIKAGLGYLLSRAPATGAVIIMVCDQPLLTAAHLRTIRNKFKETQRAVIASAYAGTCGVPALFSRELFDNLLRIKDEAGAKKIILEHKESLLEIDFPEGAVDLDTPDDYEGFINR